MSEAVRAARPRAADHLSRLVDRRELLHLDRPRRRPAGVEPAGRRARRRSRRQHAGRRRDGWRGARERSSSPKAATGSGGTATTIRRRTISSSTICSGGTCGTSIDCCRRPVPDELFVSNISAELRVVSPQSHPTGLISPMLDGEANQLLRMARRRGRGGTGRRAALCIRSIARRASCAGPVRLRPRVSPRPGRRQPPLAQLLAEGYEFSLKFMQPAGVRFPSSGMTRAPTAGSGATTRRRLAGTISDGSRRRCLPAAILEVSLPLKVLEAGSALSFFVATYDRGQQRNRTAAGAPRHRTHRSRRPIRRRKLDGLDAHPPNRGSKRSTAYPQAPFASVFGRVP